MAFGLWLTFFAACWAISLSPGPGAVAALSAGLAHGFRKGYFVVFGLILGIWTQLAVVGIGLGALMQTSQTLFTTVKWLGAAYLIVLGIQQWRAPAAPWQTQAPAGRLGHGALVARGWAINAINPKGTVFLLAVVPSFVDPARPLLPQYLTIAASLTLTDLVVMAGYTALAARLLRGLRSPGHLRAINRTFGGFFVAAGAALAWFRR